MLSFRSMVQHMVRQGHDPNDLVDQFAAAVKAAGWMETACSGWVKPHEFQADRTYPALDVCAHCSRLKVEHAAPEVV